MFADLTSPTLSSAVHREVLPHRVHEMFATLSDPDLLWLRYAWSRRKDVPADLAEDAFRHDMDAHVVATLASNSGVPVDVCIRRLATGQRGVEPALRVALRADCPADVAVEILRTRARSKRAAWVLTSLLLNGEIVAPAKPPLAPEVVLECVTVLASTLDAAILFGLRAAELGESYQVQLAQLLVPGHAGLPKSRAYGAEDRSPFELIITNLLPTHRVLEAVEAGLAKATRALTAVEQATFRTWMLPIRREDGPLSAPAAAVFASKWTDPSLLLALAAEAPALDEDGVRVLQETLRTVSEDDADRVIAGLPVAVLRQLTAAVAEVAGWSPADRCYANGEARELSDSLLRDIAMLERLVAAGGSLEFCSDQRLDSSMEGSACDGWPFMFAVLGTPAEATVSALLADGTFPTLVSVFEAAAHIHADGSVPDASCPCGPVCASAGRGTWNEF